MRTVDVQSIYNDAYSRYLVPIYPLCIVDKLYTEKKTLDQFDSLDESIALVPKNTVVSPVDSALESQ